MKIFIPVSYTHLDVYKRQVRISSDAVRIEPIIVAPVIAVPVLCAGMFVIIGYGRNKKSKGGEVNENTEKD